MTRLTTSSREEIFPKTKLRLVGSVPILDPSPLVHSSNLPHPTPKSHPRVAVVTVNNARIMFKRCKIELKNRLDKAV